MITIYKTTEQGLEKIKTPVNGSWVNVVNPTRQEIKKLVSWGMEMEFVNYSLDQDEIARMERDDEYTFILLRIPIHQPESDIPYTTVPLGIMILGNKIITVCHHDNDILHVLAGNIVY